MTTRRLSSDGRRVHEKAGSGRRRTDLRREATNLAGIGVGPVVELLDLIENDTETILLTADAGSLTLAELNTADPGSIFKSLKHCVSAVRELHSRGWSHGDIRAEHVVVGSRSRVRFCSLANATPLNGTSELLHRQLDVDRIVEIAKAISERPAAPRSFLNRVTWQMARRRLSAGLRSFDKDRSDPASDLTLLEALFDDLSDDSTSTAKRSAAVVSAAVVGVLLTITLTLTLAARALRQSDTAAARLNDVHSVESTTRPRASETPNLVATAGTVYRVGDPDDVVVVGDWNCDDIPTALLLRPSTGEVFEFPEWAEEGAEETASYLQTVKGATGLRKESGRCDIAIIERSDGSAIRLPPDAAEPTEGRP